LKLYTILLTIKTRNYDLPNINFSPAYCQYSREHKKTTRLGFGIGFLFPCYTHFFLAEYNSRNKPFSIQLNKNIMDDFDKGYIAGLRTAKYSVYGAIQANIYQYRLSPSHEIKKTIMTLCLVRSAIAKQINHAKNECYGN